MTVDQPGSRYTLSRVLRYIARVEEAYGVSLKFWLSFRENNEHSADMFIFAWGSGGAFDKIPLGIQPRGCEVDWEESEPVGEALYHAVLYIEMLFSKAVEPIGTRPSL